MKLEDIKIYDIVGTPNGKGVVHAITTNGLVAVKIPGLKGHNCEDVVVSKGSIDDMEKHGWLFFPDNLTALDQTTPQPIGDERVQKMVLKSADNSGNKYHRQIRDIKGRLCMVLDKEREEYIPAMVDFYSIEKACEIPGGGVTHCAKKVLYSGIRGKGSRLQDLVEARDALTREIDELMTSEKKEATSA